VIVLDASAAVSALLNDGEARRLVASESLHVPHLIDVEVLSAIRRQTLASELSTGQAERVLGVWGRIGLVRYAAGPLLARAWTLRDSVTAYDAIYVALAEFLGCALVTADARLAGASGKRCATTVVPR
jgi:predicted nucleic acid-binding protein